MKKNIKFLLLCAVISITSCSKEYSFSTDDIIGEWEEINVPRNSGIIFLNDTTYIANNIFNIGLWLARDSILIENEYLVDDGYKYYNQYQTHGVVGTWSVKFDSLQNHYYCRLLYPMSKNKNDFILNKKLEIKRVYKYGFIPTDEIEIIAELDSDPDELYPTKTYRKRQIKN